MNKKLLVSLIISMVIVITGNFTFAVELKDLNLTAKEVGVYELKNLNPVYEKDARKQVPVASLTKIMTAIVCLENVDMNEKVIVMKMIMKTQMKNIMMKNILLLALKISKKYHITI